MICKDFAYGGLIEYFKTVSSIPRPTFHEEKIADYLCDFAKKRGLEYYRDELNNVLICKGGSEGREQDSPLLLQGHTDMVCEKNKGVEHDFFLEGIKLCERDGWLCAEGTTLGADNGVAVATMLYLLDGAEENALSHPPIECLFTASEEVGLSGAQGFDYSKIKAKRMINLDSADESQIIAGCAGGQRLTAKMSVKTEPTGIGDRAVKLTVKGLAGGHSGEDIHRGRANANKLIGRVLFELSGQHSFRLASVNGGTKDNAIPREAEAILTVSGDDISNAVKSIKETIKAELCTDDREFELNVSESALPSAVMSLEDTENVIFFLQTVQNGVFEMHNSIEGLVEFSRNLGIVKTSAQGDRVDFTLAARSPKPSQLAYSSAQIEAYAKQLDMTIEYGAGYPGWIYAESSEIRNLYVNVYKELYGKAPEITVIHAGLECGIIKERRPDMDIIS